MDQVDRDLLRLPTLHPLSDRLTAQIKRFASPPVPMATGSLAAAPAALTHKSVWIA